MKKYHFTIYLGVYCLDDIPEDVMNALFESGCDDATFASSAGSSYAHFDREAESFEIAVDSAIKDIQKGFDAVNFSCEIVGYGKNITDLADIPKITGE